MKTLLNFFLKLFTSHRTPYTLHLTAFFFCSFGQATAQSDTLTSKTTTAVTVVASKPFIQTMVDKTVLNIASKPTAAGQNALELLKSAPGVVVDPNENIQMGGKTGVTVLIDDRNTQLSAQDLAQLLKSIDADNIKEIEIITNPSARFDAAGNAGIINIRLKKSLTNGYNASITGSYSQSTHARGSGSTTMNYRKNKLNWYGNAGFNKGFQITTANNDRITNIKTYQQRGLEDDAFHSSNIRSGIDYMLNKKTTIGVLWMHNNRYSGMDNKNYTIVQENNAPDTNVVTRSIAPFTTGRNNININYRYVNDKKSELNIDADYTSFISTLNNTITTERFNNSFAKYGGESIRNNASVKINIKSIKADYTKYINEKSKLTTGFKLVQTSANNQLAVTQFSNNAWNIDTGKTNAFKFNESIQAAYLGYETSFKKLTLQAGLRAEYSMVNGYSVDLKNNSVTKPDTAYLNLFPTLFIQYKINEHNQLGLSLGRRIDRPTYQDQNPFIYVLDAFNSEQGNPYLIPQITQNIELGYTYKYASSIKVKYSHTSQYIEMLTYQTGNNTVLIPQNVGTRKVINIALSTAKNINQWWSLYINAEPYYQQYKTRLNSFGTNEQIQQQSWGFNGYLSNTFNLMKGFKADISSWFNYQNTTTIYKAKPIGSINIGVSKKIMKEHASLKLAVNDLFNTQRWEQTAVTSSLNLLTYRKWESRNITISFSYRFGNNKIKSAREREVGSTDEMDRIK